MVRIAIDAMTAEGGLELVVKGAKKALKNLDSDDEIILVGNQVLKDLIDTKDFSYVYAPDVFPMNKDPKTSRIKRTTSVMTAANLVKNGNADIFLSPGNTGASVVASVYNNRISKDIKNLPLAAIVPTRISGKDAIFLDVGGSYVDAEKGLEYNVQMLQHFAIMGNAFYKAKFNEIPRIGLCNVGEEAYKGPKEIKECAKLLEKSDLNYIGFVEGNDIMKGEVDVFVTNGYTGNFSLKSMEGTISTMSHIMKDGVLFSNLKDIKDVVGELNKNIELIKEKDIRGLIESFDFKIPKTIGAYSAKFWGMSRDVKRRLSPEEYGGAMLLGVEKPTVVMHGSATAKSMESAIYLAKEWSKLTPEINQEIKKYL